MSWGPCSFKVSGSAQLEKNKIGAGDVTAVFWACLIPAINLQMRIPPISKIIVLAKGAIAALAAFLGVTADSKHPDSKHPVPFFIQVCTRKSRPLRKIKHSKCCGKLALKTKSRLLTLLRSTLSVLKNVSIFFPANETSVTVGSSGSVHYRTNLTIEDV